MLNRSMPTIPGEEALRALPEKLLAGVSGGLDSVALLHALVKVGRRPVVLHFDHGWRTESRADAAWVERLARKLGLKFVAGKAAARTPRTESAARTARYAFFTASARRLKIHDLVLAHQADDQVETFLLQLFRGAGAAGRGMDPLARQNGLVLHRPWLGVWRGEISAFARRERILWREDASNRDARHRRNLIRHRVLPYLQRTISPGVGENLWRAAEIAREESTWLDALCVAEAKGATLPVAKLRAEPTGWQRRTILRWLQARGVGDVGFTDVEAVRALLTREKPAKVNLAGGKHARRRAGKIFVE